MLTKINCVGLTIIGISGGWVFFGASGCVSVETALPARTVGFSFGSLKIYAGKMLALMERSGAHAEDCNFRRGK